MFIHIWLCIILPHGYSYLQKYIFITIPRSWWDFEIELFDRCRYEGLIKSSLILMSEIKSLQKKFNNEPDTSCNGLQLRDVSRYSLITYKKFKVKRSAVSLLLWLELDLEECQILLCFILVDMIVGWQASIYFSRRALELVDEAYLGHWRSPSTCQVESSSMTIKIPSR